MLQGNSRRTAGRIGEFSGFILFLVGAVGGLVGVLGLGSSLFILEGRPTNLVTFRPWIL